jgi:hypothetical protein
MKTNIFKIAAVVLLLTASVPSCEDDSDYKPDCASGRCETVNIKGSLRVVPSGDGLRGVPVEVILVNHAGKWNTSKKVVSGKTDRDGVFNFNVTIDINSFENNHHLRVMIPNQKDYINISNLEHFFRYDENALSNIHFEFYNRAQLTIHLNRTQTDEFDEFALGHFFLIGGYGRLLFIERDPAPKPARTFQIETAADVYTKIVWTKSLNREEIFQNFDSLICRQNSNNVINVNY